MNTVASRKQTVPRTSTADLTLTPLPHWASIAEAVMHSDACGSLCIHACFTRAAHAPTRHEPS